MNYKMNFGIITFLTIFILCFPSDVRAASLMIDPSDARTDNSFIMETTIRSYDDTLVVRKPYDVTTVYRYDTIFIYSEQVFELPEYLEDQLKTYEGRIVILGKLPKTKYSWTSFQTDGTVEVFTLKGEPLQYGLSIERVLPNKRLKTLVEGERYDEKYPYVVTNENGLYYVASARVEGLKQYVLNDLLGQLYNVKRGHQAYIRLEDIDYSSDASQLKEVTDYLKSEHIPILLSVKLDQSKTNEPTIKKNEPLIKLLRNLQADGARIILDTSFNDLERSIRYMMHQKLYPFAIETTEVGLLPQKYYETIARFSDLYFGPLTNRHSGKVQHVLPSTITNLDRLVLYPETIGIVDQSEVSIFRTWQHKMQLLTELQASTFGISYYPYLGVEPLKKAVAQMREVNDLQWIEWDSFETTVRTSTATIQFSENRSISITKDNPIYDQWLYVWENKTNEMILWILVILVATFVTLFTFYIVHMRLRLRKRLFRERSY